MDRDLSKGENMKMRCVKARKTISLAMDDRLTPAARAALQEHLQSCPSCREWQQEQSWLRELVQAPRPIEPSPGFYAGLMAQVSAAPRRPRLSAFSSLFYRPMVLRAAMLLLLVFSALLGFSLSGRFETPTVAASTAFNQALNLDAFADLPGDSFGAVYDRLLQGELQ